MLYAKVVTGLAVDGPFDYIVPQAFIKRIKIGARVRVDFRNNEKIGYVVGLAGKTNIRKLKEISELIDDCAVLNKNLLSLTKSLADYYCCCWGEAIETSLPEDLRKGKKVSGIKQICHVAPKGNAEASLVHDLDGKTRWEIYLSELRNTVNAGRSAIILLPDIDSVFKAKEKISSALRIEAEVLFRKQKSALEGWLSIRNAEYSIVVGTRSAIFAPLNNLGLVIIDEEEDSVYKQDQVPHYNAREVAFMRINIEKAKLILSSSSPSLESFYSTKKKKSTPLVAYKFLSGEKEFPEVKIMDSRRQPQNTKHKRIISRYLEDSIASVLESGGKTLLFLNRKGFATYASCLNCGSVLKCPRCNINLVYHFKENVLNCHYCNHKIPAQTICPNCNAGCIRYLGVGAEKIESELSRIFPSAKIKLLDKKDKLSVENADIFVSTESAIRDTAHNFDLTAALSIDNSLNRIDFRSSEKAFGLLTGLLRVSGKKIIIQTAFPSHHCFAALENKDIGIFYGEELKQRKQLNFPPFSHIGLVKLRGKKEASVKEASESLFNRLTKANKNKNIELICVNPASPSKLRGNYCWQILIKTDSCVSLSRFLKIHLKGLSSSGIIVTVDIDPV